MRALVERPRLRDRLERIEIDPGFDDVVAGGDPCQAIARHSLARGPTPRDLGRDLGRGKFVERAGGFGVHRQFFPARPSDVTAILPNTVPEMRPEPPG